MSYTLHKNDLPADVEFGEYAAVDTETRGLNPQRDPLCLVQISNGDGHAHIVQLDRENYEAPNLREASNWDYYEEYYNTNYYQNWEQRTNPCKDAYYRFDESTKSKRNFMAFCPCHFACDRGTCSYSNHVPFLERGRN